MPKKDEEFVPVKEPTKKRKPRKKAAPKKRATKSKVNGTELRITELESAHLDITERDVELAAKDIELVNAQLRNLAMDYERKKKQLADRLEVARRKSEQVALIRNKVLSEIEMRLIGIDKDFSFKTHLQQEDGTFVREEDIVAAKDPTNDQPAPDQLAT
jgi:hypothetical protein